MESFIFQFCLEISICLEKRLDGHEFEQALGVVMDREAWRGAVHGVTKSRT